MALQIREMRKLHFQNLIITPSVINRLAYIIDQEMTAINNSEPYIISYMVEASDNSSYESGSKEIFSSPEIMETKTLLRIQMRLQTLSNDKNIELQLLHSLKDSATGNYLLVSGGDSVWVNGVMTRLSEILRSSEGRPGLMNYLEVLQLVAVIAFLTVYFRLFYTPLEAINNPWISITLVLGIPLLFIIFITRGKTYIEGLWPDMELQTGPNHLQRPAKKRGQLAWVITAILLPLLTGFIYDMLKNWFHLF